MPSSRYRREKAVNLARVLQFLCALLFAFAGVFISAS